MFLVVDRKTWTTNECMYCCYGVEGLSDRGLWLYRCMCSLIISLSPSLNLPSWPTFSSVLSSSFSRFSLLDLFFFCYSGYSFLLRSSIFTVPKSYQQEDPVWTSGARSEEAPAARAAAPAPEPAATWRWALHPRFVHKPPPRASFSFFPSCACLHSVCMYARLYLLENDLPAAYDLLSALPYKA